MLSMRCRLPSMLASALLCSAHAFAANATLALDPGPDPTEGIEGTLSWNDKSAGRNVQKLVLPEYSIEFLMDNSASSAAGKTSVAMTWQLKGVGPAELPGNLPEYLEQVERDIIGRALQQTQFNRTQAASLLGISVRQLRYQMQKLDISAPDD